MSISFVCDLKLDTKCFGISIAIIIRFQSWDLPELLGVRKSDKMLGSDHFSLQNSKKSWTDQQLPTGRALNAVLSVKYNNKEKQQQMQNTLSKR
jgi:hypothetical protein